MQDLDSLSTQMMQIQKTVDSFISLEDSFKGQAAEGIRSFYRECHVPLLLLIEGFMKDYQDKLIQIQDSLQSMEPNKNAFIRQDFLQNDLEQKIHQAENVTIGLTDEMNASINAVRDIVSLPSIDDGEFLHRAKQSREMINNTVEKVHTFDAQSTSSLGEIENDLHLMGNYINKINGMFDLGSISVDNYSVRQLSGYEFHQDLLHAVSKKARTNAFSLDAFLGMGATAVLTRFGPLSNYLISHLQEKFEMRTMDYSVRAMQGIIQASSNRISKEQFATYQFVDKIPENRDKPEEKNAFQKTGDAFQEIGADIWNGLGARANKATDSLYDFGNYMTLGSLDIGKNISTGLRYNAENMLNSPADFANWLTIGGVDTIKGAINPEENFSKEHWLASFALTTAVVGGAKLPASSATKPASIAKANPVTNNPKTSSVPVVTKPPRLNTLTNVREWFRVNLPEIGFVYDSTGGYHFVVKKGDGGVRTPKPVRPKASKVRTEISKKPSVINRKQNTKRLSNADLNKLVKDNFVLETSRTRTFTPETMPGSKDFSKWFNELSVDEFELAWATPKLRTIIESRLRYPGGYHEWHLVSRAPIFKRWGVTAENIAEMRTLTKDVEFVNPVGKHGFDGSGKAHRELLHIIDYSLDYDTFKRKLKNWSHYRLKGGIDSLPKGLR